MQVADTQFQNLKITKVGKGSGVACVFSNQCCHSVMKKNKTPNFTLKKTENKKTQIYKMFLRSQNQTWKVRYQYFHIKI